MSIETYTGLITSEHSDKKNFVSVVTSSVNPQVQLQSVLLSMLSKFDLDLAQGDQLDQIGLWVGISRFIRTPLTGVYFAWDDSTVGWEFGIWQGPFSPTSGLTALPDDVYLTLIKAKIAANHWAGNVPDAYAIWETIFTNTKILIQDYNPMSIIIGVVGAPLDVLTQALITGGYLQLKPEGVDIELYAVPVDTNAFFAWDSNGSHVKGWDTGSWAKILQPT